MAEATTQTSLAPTNPVDSSPGTGGDSADAKPNAEPPPVPPKDDLVTTRHTLKVGRRTLRYTATAGRIVLREEVFEDGVFKGHKAKAELGVTSYVLDAPSGSNRPVTFAFNGGPGSSSVWLHLGLLGPRRVDSGDVGHLTPPPYGLVDNTETLLAVSDLVFIDPVSTGYSRAVEGGKPKDYHGFKADIESVGELIRLWTTRHNRWLSPKFIAGESYGTIRAAALAEHLQTRHGLYVNGIMLISSVLDLATVDFEFRNDRAHVDYLPTYAATAHYHGKHGRKSLKTVLAEAEEYAARDYPWALSRGSRLTAAERAEHVSRLAALIGLSEEYVDRADLRVNTCASSPSCCATRGWRWAGSTRGSPARSCAGTRRRGTPTRRWTRSAAPTPLPGTTTCATSSATRTTCPTPRSPSSRRPSGPSRSSRANPST
jgi:carboxypeptidase C (cathepsin A)